MLLFCFCFLLQLDKQPKKKSNLNREIEIKNPPQQKTTTNTNCKHKKLKEIIDSCIYVNEREKKEANLKKYIYGYTKIKEYST